MGPIKVVHNAPGTLGIQSEGNKSDQSLPMRPWDLIDVVIFLSKAFFLAFQAALEAYVLADSSRSPSFVLSAYFVESFHCLSSHEALRLQVPDKGMIYSFNEGNYGGWSEGLRKYMDSLKDSSKWGGKPYSSRYLPF